MPDPAHQPLEKVSDAELTRRLNKGGNRAELPGGIKEENIKLATEELGLISELRNSAAFNWFFKECVEKKFAVAREQLESADTSPEDLAQARDRFLALREIVRWLNEREYEHRRLRDEKDPLLLKIDEDLRRQ